MNKQDLYQLLARYTEGKCTAEEKYLIDKWYDSLENETVEKSVTPGDLSAAEFRAWEAVVQPVLTDNTRLIYPVKRNRIRPLTIAAAIISVVVGAWFMYQPGNDSNLSFVKKVQKEKGLVEADNTTGTVKEITLEEGSKILLQPAASVFYPSHFARDNREVYLNGEAFFKVSKNAARPFYVYNNKVVTKVLGTSFTIIVDDKKANVLVKTGRVIVYEYMHEQKTGNAENQTNGVVLTPNQQVVYNPGNRSFTMALAARPEPVVKEVTGNGNAGTKEMIPARRRYDDAALSVVLNDLKKVYGIDIVTANSNLNNYPFTGDISDTTLSLYDKLNLICQTVNAGYKVKGVTIVITGKK